MYMVDERGVFSERTTLSCHRTNVGQPPRVWGPRASRPPKTRSVRRDFQGGFRPAPVPLAHPSAPPQHGHAVAPGSSVCLPAGHQSHLEKLVDCTGKARYSQSAGSSTSVRQASHRCPPTPTPSVQFGTAHESHVFCGLLQACGSTWAC